MSHDLTVSAWVAIRTGCPIACHLNATGQLEFTCGSARSGFDFVFDPAPLQEFIRKGADALAELAVLETEANAAEDDTPTEEPDREAGQP